MLLVFLFLDKFLTHDLLTLLLSTPARQMSRHHLDTSSIEIYWGLYLSSSCDLPVIYSISLSIYCCFLSQTLTSLPQICSTGFFKLHQAFLHVVSFYSLAFHAFMLLKPRFRDFFFFFLNCGFSKLMRYCWNFGLVFEDLILKTSCIALHLHYNSINMHLDVCNLICVLVGLDWAEPMMYLLCMSHVHAFSMHLYVFSHILTIVNCFGAFLILFLYPLYFCLH